MKYLLVVCSFILLSFSVFAGDFFVVSFSEYGPMTVEGRNRDYIWIIPANSVKRLVPAEIYPIVINATKEDIKYLSNYSPYCTIYSYDSELEKLVKKHRKKVASFKTRLGKLKFITTVYVTPIQGVINKYKERNTICCSNDFTYWREGFDSDEYYELSYKWFPSVPYRFSSDFYNELY